MSVSEATSPKFCTSCGEQLEGAPKFCTVCGKPITSAAAEANKVEAAGPTIMERVKELLSILKPTKNNFLLVKEFLKNNFEAAHIVYLILFFVAMLNVKGAIIALLIAFAASYCLATIQSPEELKVNHKLRMFSTELKEKQAAAKRQQEEAAAQAEAKKRQVEMEEYRANKEKMAKLVAERERKHRERLAAQEAKLADLKAKKTEEHEAIIVQSRKVMEEEGLTKAEIAVEIAKQQVRFDKEVAELTIESIKEEPQIEAVMTTQTINSSERKWVPEPTQSVSTLAQEPFKVQKHGTVINWLIILAGLIPIYFIYDFLANGFGLPVLGSMGVAGVFLVLFLIDLIYYLPTLIYHASTGGKIVMFILNSMFSWLFIPWLIFLIFAMSRNSNHRYKEEMLYHQRKL